MSLVCAQHSDTQARSRASLPPILEGNREELEGQGLWRGDPPHRPPKAASVGVLGAAQGFEARLPRLCVPVLDRPFCPLVLGGAGARAETESAKNPASHLTCTRVCACTPTHTRPPAETHPSLLCVSGEGLGWLAPGTQVHGTVSGSENDRAPRTPVGLVCGRVEPSSTPLPSASVPSPSPSRGRAPQLAALTPEPLRGCPGHPRHHRAGPGLVHALSSRLCLASRFRQEGQASASPWGRARRSEQTGA